MLSVTTAQLSSETNSHGNRLFLPDAPLSMTRKDWLGLVKRGEIKTCVVEFGRKSMVKENGGNDTRGTSYVSASVLSLYVGFVAARVYINPSDRNAKRLGIAGTEMTVEIERLHPTNDISTKAIEDVTSANYVRSPAVSPSHHVLSDLFSRSLSFVSARYQDSGREKSRRDGKVYQEEATLLSRFSSASLNVLAESFSSLFRWEKNTTTRDEEEKHQAPDNTDEENGLVILEDYRSGYKSDPIDEDSHLGRRMRRATDEDFWEEQSGEMSVQSNRADYGASDNASVKSEKQEGVQVGDTIGLCIDSKMYEATIMAVNEDGTWAVQFRGEDCIRAFRPYFVVVE